MIHGLRRLCLRSLTTEGAWKTVIGLEVHAQLAAKHKLFSSAPNDMTAPPNTHVAPFDRAEPGSLPTLNWECVELAVRAALALGFDLERQSLFERKHYLYPDLPAGYQITQNRFPLARHGTISVQDLTIRLKQLQLEQDTARSIYGSDGRLETLDLNRCGVGLMEIVTEPDIHSATEAVLVARHIQEALIDVGACQGVLAQGHMRFDVNVSVTGPRAPVGAPPLGERVEIKNINTFGGLATAIKWEVARQIAILEAGKAVKRETRAFDEQAGQTVPKRSKEEAPDYRFLTEHDLPPLILNDEFIERVRRGMPKLRQQKIEQVMAQYQLDKTQATLLIKLSHLHPQIPRVFEAFTARLDLSTFADAKVALDFLANKYLGACQKHERSLPDELLVEMLHQIIDGKLSRTPKALSNCSARLLMVAL